MRAICYYCNKTKEHCSVIQIDGSVPYDGRDGLNEMPKFALVCKECRKECKNA